MATLDVEGRVLQLSDSWYKFTGLSVEESLGSGWVSAIHPDDAVGIVRAWADVIQSNKQKWTYEARYRKASTGEYCWFLIRAHLYKNSSGQAACWYSSMMDVNDAVMGRQEVDGRRQSMISLISRTDVLLWGIDRENKLFIREGGLKWDPPELPSPAEIDKTGQASQSPNHNDHETLVYAVQAILAGRKFTPVIEHTEGERHFRTIFVAEGGASHKDVIGEAALALTFETTDQMVQSALRLDNKRLVTDERAASEANARKGRFLANMSHEIRTPISGIIGLIELLQDSKITKDQADLIFDIRSSAKFLLELVNDILDLSKINSGQLSIECIPFSPCETIRETIVPLQLQAITKGLELRWSYDDSTESMLLGDPLRIRQILTNLIGNSIKFTHEGAIHLDVTTTKESATGMAIVQFSVQDSGIGIADDAKKMLFKPFSQADTSIARVYGGTGLGLSICQELVGLMGGRMTIQSTLGKGTKVIFSLPFALHNPSIKADPQPDLSLRTQSSSTAHSIATTPPLAHEPSKASPQSLQNQALPAVPFTPFVLIVDDNEVNLKVNSRILQKSGYGIAIARNGQEALDYLCRSSPHPRPDMVFMDCMMPVVDGYEATRRIRTDKALFDEHTRDLPVVGLTASALLGNMEQCWEAGMDDCIVRPVRQKGLREAVLKWTGEGRETVRRWR